MKSSVKARYAGRYLSEFWRDLFNTSTLKKEASGSS
jgi:hypothetical protein